MSAHVLLNILNKLGKRHKMRDLPSILSVATSLINSTRAHSRWGAIANPHAKVFDSPITTQSNPMA